MQHKPFSIAKDISLDDIEEQFKKEKREGQQNILILENQGIIKSLTNSQAFSPMRE